MILFIFIKLIYIWCIKFVKVWKNVGKKIKTTCNPVTPQNTLVVPHQVLDTFLC